MEERLAIVADSGQVIAEELSAYIRGEKQLEPYRSYIRIRSSQ